MTMSESRMAKDAEIVVARVANGYIVQQRPGRDCYMALDESLVFPSFAALVEHLAKHFTHRCASAPMDEPLGLDGLPLIEGH